MYLIIESASISPDERYPTKMSFPQVGDMGSIVFPAARALVAWLEQHGGNLQGVRALGMIFYVLMVLDQS